MRRWGVAWQSVQAERGAPQEGSYEMGLQISRLPAGAGTRGTAAPPFRVAAKEPETA